MQRRFCRLPRLSTIGRAKHPRDFGAAGAEPGMVRTLYKQTGVAGCKGSFLGQTRRAGLLPGCAAIVGPEDQKAAFDGIAEHNAVLAIPKGNRVKEHSGSF